ncbi:MAG: LamB/YcsF family protein [Betaproteobacteria bacterium]|nr:LamB/YcsF family protein [Betaproteobacteria bacterium]
MGSRRWARCSPTAAGRRHARPARTAGRQIRDAAQSVAQVMSMIDDGVVVSTNQGKRVPVSPDTLCPHGDQPQKHRVCRSVAGGVCGAGDFPVAARLDRRKPDPIFLFNGLQRRVHSIHRVSTRKNDAGMAIPIALAVLRLMTSSNFVGCCTGRVAGLAPLKTLST